MKVSDNDLRQAAESILETLEGRNRQLLRLFDIEDELKARGAEDDALFQRIDAYRRTMDPGEFRCEYHLF